MVNKFGTFEIVWTPEAMDFYKDYPGAGDQFKNMAGVRESVTFTEICPGKVAAHWIVHSSPKPWTFFATFTEGIEQTIDFGHFGGKNKVNFNATADGYKTCMESEKYGKTSLVEVFTDSGLDREVTYNGKTAKEHWKRVINENGFYRVCGNENAKEFMKANGFPDALAASALTDFKIYMWSDGSTFKMVEWFGPDLKIETSGAYDTEIEQKGPVEGFPDSKFVVTKIGCGKYKSIAKDDVNGTTEWDFVYGDGTLCITGKSLKHGISCKFMMKKYIPICGTFKTIAIENAKELICALGLPAEIGQKAATDFATVVIEDNCPVYRWDWQGVWCPCDMTFKMDEEFEYMDPHLNEKGTIVVSQSGNKLITTSKYSTTTWITVATYTDNFLIIKSSVKGLNHPPMVYVMERTCS